MKGLAVALQSLRHLGKIKLWWWPGFCWHFMFQVLTKFPEILINFKPAHLTDITLYYPTSSHSSVSTQLEVRWMGRKDTSVASCLPGSWSLSWWCNSYIKHWIQSVQLTAHSNSWSNSRFILRTTITWITRIAWVPTGLICAWVVNLCLNVLNIGARHLFCSNMN